MNVNLWFARDNHNEITTILNSNNEDAYTCPICNSEVIPKALESKQVTPHFAHIDRNKCTGESFIHFWMKHGFIERGDTFSITSDEKYTFTCKDFKTEVTFNLDSGVYRPDIVVETECGNDIVFEMAHKNKKKVQDYIDRWIELDKIVVEVDTPTLTGQNEVKEFKALYFKGKCFNFNKRDGGYYNTIGKLKEEMKKSGKYDVELIRKLDWFWREIVKYNSKEINIEEFSLYYDTLNDETKYRINNIISYKKCSDILYEYSTHKANILRFRITNSIDIPYFLKDFITINTNISLSKYNLIPKYEVVIRNVYDRSNYIYCESKKDIENAIIFIKNQIESLKNCENIRIYNSIINNKLLLNTILSFENKIRKEFPKLEYKLREDVSELNINVINVTDEKCKLNYIHIPYNIAKSDDENEIYLFLKNSFEKYRIILRENKNIVKLKSLLHKNPIISSLYLVTPNLLKFQLYTKVDNTRYINQYYLLSDENLYKVESLIGHHNYKDYLNKMDNGVKVYENVGIVNISDIIESELLNFINSKNECKGCGANFKLNLNEYHFFNQEGFESPKRCKSCRQKRKLGGVR